MTVTATRDMGDDIRLRTLFNDQARQYDEARPHYPKALFDALVSKTDLSKAARLLEIGPGTGQATVTLAKQGYKIVAVELGPQLAAVARQKLRKYKNAEVITGAFEDVVLPDQSFDLVYSATAFHWIQPEVRYYKPHQLLKSDGHLAIIQTNHVSDGQGDIFFYASQPIYDKHAQKSKDKPSLLLTKDLKPPDDLDTKLFDPVYFGCFPLVVEYPAEQYAKLVATYSPHLALPPTTRAVFLSDIEKLINGRFKGVLTKHYVMSLTIARKISRTVPLALKTHEQLY